MSDSSDNLEQKKLRAEIDRINAEKDKILQETANLKKSTTFSFISNFVSVVGGLIIGALGILAVVTGAERALLQKEKADWETDKITGQKNELLAQKNQLIKEKGQLENEINDLRKTRDDFKNSLSKDQDRVAKATSLAELQKTQGLVFIQFRGSLDRDLMKELAKLYQKKGFRAPGVERVAGSYQTEVRYSNQSDVKLASQVATIAKDFFAQKNCPIQQEIKTSINKNIPKGQVEIWVDHSCS